MDILTPEIGKRYGSYIVATRDGHELSQWVQINMGDCLARNETEHCHIIDVKAERKNKHNNFFLERFSNRSRNTPGWFVTARYTKLWYFFLDAGGQENNLFIIDFDRLRKWAHGPSRNGQRSRLADFPLKPQTERKQPNDTWGRCAKIDVVRDEVEFDEELRIDVSM